MRGHVLFTAVVCAGLGGCAAPDDPILRDVPAPPVRMLDASCSLRDRNGDGTFDQVTRFGYDGYRWLASADASVGSDEQWSSRPDGFLLRHVTIESGSRREEGWMRDAEGRILAHDAPEGDQFYQYDELGRLEDAVEDGLTTHFGYGSDELLDLETAETFDAGGRRVRRTLYTHVQGSNVLTCDIDDGADGSIDRHVTETYDDQHRLLWRTVEHRSGPEHSQSDQWKYDARGALIYQNHIEDLHVISNMRVELDERGMVKSIVRKQLIADDDPLVDTYREDREVFGEHCYLNGDDISRQASTSPSLLGLMVAPSAIPLH